MQYLFQTDFALLSALLFIYFLLHDNILHNQITFVCFSFIKIEHLNRIEEAIKVCALLIEWFGLFLAPIMDVNWTTLQLLFLTNHLVLLYVAYVFAIDANKNLWS